MELSWYSLIIFNGGLGKPAKILISLACGIEILPTIYQELQALKGNFQAEPRM
jgi:hypothetical protein